VLLAHKQELGKQSQARRKEKRKEKVATEDSLG
jgi:hypothetical protein